MKNKVEKYIKTLKLLLVVCMLFSTVLQAQITKSNVYVWDFKTNDNQIKKFAEKFTSDFETALIKLNQYTVLQRRNHSLVLVHREMESAISSVKNLPEDAVKKLKTIRADFVVFGELIEDEDSGVFEVTVFFQNLTSGQIPKKESIIIEKALIKSNSHRKEYMKSLITQLHAKEISEAKNKQLGFISNKMDTYMVKVKDVQTAFEDIISFALEKEAYFKELETTINNYNNIFIDINDNRERYLLEFESVFGKSYGMDLEDVFKGILDNIHKKHILKLNTIRKNILIYRQSQNNKSERDRLGKEIIKDSENSTLGLTTAIDHVEDDIDELFSSIKKDMREE